MEHEIRDKILQKLMHKRGLFFNELWNKEGESNKFAYHLKLMLEENLVEKKNEKYFLTDDGKALASFVDGETGKKLKLPVVCLLMCIFDEEQNKLLMYKRTKEPFYGYCGFIGGKLDFGEEILDGAARELKEETNLKAELKIAGVMNFNVLIVGDKKFHNVYFVIKGSNPEGKLIGDIREGEYSFVSEEDFLKEKLFPDNVKILELLKTDKFFSLEVEVNQEKGEFKEVSFKELNLY